MSDTTYMQCYGVHAETEHRFVPRSELIQKSWALSTDKSYVKLAGRWKDNSMTATTENYFVVEQINGHAVPDAEVPQRLAALSKATIAKLYPDVYAENVAAFASDNSVTGYEYPLLSPSQADAIRPATASLNAARILRYAFAANFVYSLEQGADPFAFSDNAAFHELMLFAGAQQLKLVDQVIIPGGMHAVAIKVPALPAKGLDEEIIISYKGTSNRGDFWQDVDLMLANITELDEAWQQQAYTFCQKVMAAHSPSAQSFMPGYQAAEGGAQGCNLVLTGHSLGAYTATDVGLRTGLATRVFSSPATRIIRKYSRVLANQLRLNNVINFVRLTDPVAGMSGRHDENMVYFPAVDPSVTSGPDELVNTVIENAASILSGPLKGALGVSWDMASKSLPNHFLAPFISEVLLKRYQQDSAAEPRFVYITPDAMVGAGLDARVNHWGAV